ncbi:MAG TPA: TonB-dependent receptor [Nitrospiria bacterium]|nr:TonB-dependent receptor [Nitrospiria bacterium]
MNRINQVGTAVIVCMGLIFPSLGLAEEPAPPKENATEETTTNPSTEAAPTTEAGKPVTTLSPVIISATRTERTVSDLPVSSTVLDRQAVQQTPAIATDDVLREVPSLNFSNSLPSFMNHPTGNWVSIRGLGGIAPHVLVLMDGIPLNDPFFGYLDFNRVPKEAIDRIEIVRGGSSSLWGSFAEGGVVNIVTKPVDATELKVTTLGGSDGTFRTDVHSSQKIDDHLGISLDTNYFGTAGYDAVEPDVRGAIDRATASDSANVQLKMDYHTADFEGFIRGNDFKNRQRLDTRMSANDTDTVNVATGGRWILDAQSDVKANLFFLNQNFTTNNTDFSPPNFDRNAEFLSNLHQTPANDVGGSLQWTRTTDSLVKLLNAGLDIRHIEGVDRQQDIAVPGDSPTVLNGGGQQLFAGLFVQASLRPVPDWEILPSIRLDYVSDYNGSMVTIPGTTTQFDDKDYLQLNPKLATRYQIVKAVAIRASVYRGFRAPTLDNLYREFTAEGFKLLPDSQLKPEVLWGGETGLDLSQGPFQGQVNFFYNRVIDQINFITTSFSPVYTVQATNIGKTRSLGVETIGDVQLTETLSSGVSYSYTDSKIISNPPDPSIEGNRTPDVPVHSVSVVARYRQPAGAQLEVRFRLLSSMWDDTTNSLSLDAEHVVDASASYPIGKHMEVFVIGQNIFDDKYVATTSGGNHLGPPFQIFGGLTLAFGGSHE